MIVVCELLDSEHHIKRLTYDESLYSNALDMAMNIAVKVRTELKHPCWIERDGQPASRITMEREHRRQLRNPFGSRTQH